MWSTENFERRIFACKTCHGSLEICSDCGRHLTFRHPVTRIYCRICMIEAVELEEKFKRPGDMMGVDGFYISSIYECPHCRRKCCPAQEKLEEVYTGISYGEEQHSVMAKDGTKYRNIGAYIDSGT